MLEFSLYCLLDDPVGLWPMNDAYGLTDVIGGINGTAYNSGINNTYPIDLTDLSSTILNQLGPDAMNVLEGSFTFEGVNTSYVEIPNIPMQEDYTFVAFVRTISNLNGPIWQWESGGQYGDHIWLVSQHLYLRPTNQSGGALGIMSLGK